MAKARQDLEGYRFEPASAIDLRRGHHNLGRTRLVVKPPRPVLLHGLAHILKEGNSPDVFSVQYSEKKAE